MNKDEYIKKYKKEFMERLEMDPFLYKAFQMVHLQNIPEKDAFLVALVEMSKTKEVLQKKLDFVLKHTSLNWVHEKCLEDMG